MLSLLAVNFSSPPILFFILGIIIGLNNLEVRAIERAGALLGTYLIIAIGYKGGYNLAASTAIDNNFWLVAFTGIVIGFLQPFLGYYLLKKTTDFDKATIVATAAHYGSVSVSTFAAATNFLQVQGVAFDGYMVAVLALMEVPAIIGGFILLKKVGLKKSEVNKIEKNTKLLGRVFANEMVVLLLGAFFIGYWSGEEGFKRMEGFLWAPFYGILAIYLLDVGILITRNLMTLKKFSFAAIAFAIYMPVFGASLGLLFSYLFNLSIGTGMLFTVLTASASYIAVSAIMRMALPEAKVEVYMSMSLGITFPFNVLIGIPVYYKLATMWF